MLISAGTKKRLKPLFRKPRWTAFAASEKPTRREWTQLFPALLKGAKKPLSGQVPTISGYAAQPKMVWHSFISTRRYTFGPCKTGQAQ
jgi:hypothetical protein